MLTNVVIIFYVLFLQSPSLRRYLTPTLSDGATRDKDGLRMGVKKKSTRLSTGEHQHCNLKTSYNDEGIASNISPHYGNLSM